MHPAFNVLEEPWLPVTQADGVVIRVGLREAFERSQDLRGLAETSPPALVAMHRLLLAILHRALASTGEHWSTSDQARWMHEGLPQEAITRYLLAWHDRFYLFHPTAPFFQVAALATAEATREKFKPWTQLSLASVSGNAPMVFDHSSDLEPTSVAPADLLCVLLGFLQFTPAGLVRVIRGSDKAGPLVNTAATIPLGQSLAQTLILGLHPPPLPGSEPDLPSWEQPVLTLQQLEEAPQVATGPNDRYTRLSRAVLLQRETDGLIRWIRFAVGKALEEVVHAPDPMAAYRVGSTNLVRLTFVEGRALWRDLAALLPAASEDTQPASIVEWASEVRWEMADEGGYQPLLVAGVASDQAKLLRWRAEQLNLPVRLLLKADGARCLSALVGRAESLHREMRKLAISMLAQALPTPESRDTWSRAAALLEKGPFSITYFHHLERELARVMDLLMEDQAEQVEDLWNSMLRKAAIEAWQKVLISLGKSPGALRADAKYWPRFMALLKPLAPVELSTSSSASVLPSPLTKGD